MCIRDSAGSGLPQEQQNALAQQAGQQLLPLLEQAAKALPPQPELVALDWFNGRRYPYNNDQASSAVCGLDLGVSAPALYRALVEATAYGQRRIVTGLTEHGIRIDRIVAVGGIAQKSPFVMQTLSDVLQRPITVSPVSQTCALGAAIYASVGAGLYANVEQAQAAICRPCRTSYQPDVYKRQVRLLWPDIHFIKIEHRHQLCHGKRPAEMPRPAPLHHLQPRDPDVLGEQSQLFYAFLRHFSIILSVFLIWTV